MTRKNKGARAATFNMGSRLTTHSLHLTNFFTHLLRLLFHLGYFGPFVMGVMDSSFLFLPFGNDLLVTALVARNHHNFWIYVITAAIGSTSGALLVDVVARKIGETGVQKMTGERRFRYLKRKITEKGAQALIVGCLAPPPFPFTVVIAATSALAYPRRRLIWIVALARTARFLILSLLAIKFGRTILRVMSSSGFRYTMIAFAVLCVVMSVYSISSWVRSSRTAGRSRALQPS